MQVLLLRFCRHCRIFILYIILFKSSVHHYLITYKNLILFSFLYIIIDFVLCINVYATFLQNFVSIFAVFVVILHFISLCLTFGSECIYAWENVVMSSCGPVENGLRPTLFLQNHGEVYYSVWRMKEENLDSKTLNYA